MEQLVASWYNGRSLPETYVLPLEIRPGKLNVPVSTNIIPVVDLGGHDETAIIQQILEASQEFGFFQVINHGVPSNLMDEAMNVCKEFHAMSAKDKAVQCSNDLNKNCFLYTSSQRYATEKYHFWRDSLTHFCHPLEKQIQFWPEKPTRYRNVVSKYTTEVSKLGSTILGLISKGLGVSPEHFSNGLTENPKMIVNHYPPCPDPTLTLGVPKHRDPVLINILLQEDDLCGLQVFKDEEWIDVEPIPHAFVVNIGYVLQIISNGKLKGAEHRVVTNSNSARTTASFFVSPSDETLIEPAKVLVNTSSPALYRSLPYKDFHSKFLVTSDWKELEKFVRTTSA
ncbi:hyoscyamine 6-dioxygenase-like [Quercus robur]|uniref:hyoscyamine 6-dioxygenase-like n=1 Tax=Quercus robur TaxID=38942 RepID=UPI002163976B|nr:hyoscyamine 6-dioxygenase-like [Quercus robur]